MKCASVSDLCLEPAKPFACMLEQARPGLVHARCTRRPTFGLLEALIEVPIVIVVELRTGAVMSAIIARDPSQETYPVSEGEASGQLPLKMHAFSLT